MTQYIEVNVGLERYAGEPQGDKPCEECLYFERDLAGDEPCGLCYESSDNFNWKEKNGNAGCGEMELASGRVCEAPTGKGRC